MPPSTEGPPSGEHYSGLLKVSPKVSFRVHCSYTEVGLRWVGKVLQGGVDPRAYLLKGPLKLKPWGVAVGTPEAGLRWLAGLLKMKLLKTLGPLKMPFVGGSAALYLLALLYMMNRPGHYGEPVLLYTLTIGTLLSVVLYAVLRAISGRQQTS